MKAFLNLIYVALFAGAFTTTQAKSPAGSKATPKPDKVEGYLKAHDKNNDGVIDKSEFPGMSADFAKWDRNNDGKLDKGELAAMLNSTKKPK